MSRRRAHRPDSILPPDLAAMKRLARVLDASIPLPLVGRRVGLDPILGLVPGLGDAVGAGLSAAIVISALRHRVPPAILARMIGNVLVDAAGGAVPILGDLFDAAFQSNLRNVELLLEHRDEALPPRDVPATVRALVVGGASVLAAASIAVGALVIAVVATLVA